MKYDILVVTTNKEDISMTIKNTLVVDGYVTATSKKQNDKFKSAVPTITAYVKPAGQEALAKLEAFGLRKYTSKSDGENFFIIKCSANVSVYNGNDKERMDLTIENGDLFKTSEGKPVKLAIMYGEPESGNAFYRLYAISVEDYSEVETIESINPFQTEEMPL